MGPLYVAELVLQGKGFNAQWMLDGANEKLRIPHIYGVEADIPEPGVLGFETRERMAPVQKEADI